MDSLISQVANISRRDSKSLQIFGNESLITEQLKSHTRNIIVKFSKVESHGNILRIFNEYISRLPQGILTVKFLLSRCRKTSIATVWIACWVVMVIVVMVIIFFISIKPRPINDPATICRISSWWQLLGLALCIRFMHVMINCHVLLQLYRFICYSESVEPVIPQNL